MALDGTAAQPAGMSGIEPITLAQSCCPAASLRAQTWNWLPVTIGFTSPESPITLIAIGRCGSSVGATESTVQVTSALVPVFPAAFVQVARAR